MESIVILAIIYFVFKAMTKKGGNVWDAVKAKIDAATDTQTNQHVSQHPPKVKRTAPTPEKIRQAQSGAEGSAVYVPIKPTIQANNAQYTDQGSMGAVTQEGTSSYEGMGTGNAVPNQMKASSLTAYALDEPIRESMPVLPLQWNGNTMAQAVVLSIVLERPYK